MSPILSIRVLRFYEENEASNDAKGIKRSSSFRERLTMSKPRLIYDIETCHKGTGEIHRASRSYHEFKRLRDSLSRECRVCNPCKQFMQLLDNVALPKQFHMLYDAQKVGASRSMALTKFLSDLATIVSEHGRSCPEHGQDIDISVGLFLGMPSLTEGEKAKSAFADAHTAQLMRSFYMAQSKINRPRIELIQERNPHLSKSMVYYEKPIVYATEVSSQKRHSLPV